MWLHHFFTMGSSANVNAFFGIATMIIAVPTGVKIFDWLMTLYRGRIVFHPNMLWTMGFIVTFVIGGVSGVLLALPPADFLMHNSTFLVAHFHNMLIPGALFGYFAGMHYWFPKAFGFKLDDKWGVRAFWFWIVGFYLAFMPFYVMGFMGMSRRMEHYNVAEWQPYLVIASLGAVSVLIGRHCLHRRTDRGQLPRPGLGHGYDRRSMERSHARMGDKLAAGALQFPGSASSGGCRRLRGYEKARSGRIGSATLRRHRHAEEHRHGRRARRRRLRHSLAHLGGWSRCALW